jgi:hypothetical protein
VLRYRLPDSLGQKCWAGGRVVGGARLESQHLEEAEAEDFKASLDYTVRPYLKKKKSLLRWRDYFLIIQMHPKFN